MRTVAMMSELIERKASTKVRSLLGACSLYISSATDILPVENPMR